MRPLLQICALAAMAASACAGPQAMARTPDVHVALGPVTTRELVEVSGLSGLTISPDGANVVVRVDRQDLSTNRTVIVWQILRIRDGHRIATIDAGAPRWNFNGGVGAEVPQWSPDGKWIYFRKLTGEAVQVWRAAADGSRQQQISFDRADVKVFLVAADGAVHYAVGPASRDEIKAAETVEHDTGVLLDGAIIKGFPIEKSFPVNGRMATYRLLADGGRSTLLGDGPLRAMTVDPRNGSERSASDDVAKRLGELWSASDCGNQPIDPARARRPLSPRGSEAQIGALVENVEKLPSRTGQYLSVRGADGTEHACSDPVCLDADALAVNGWTIDGSSLIFQARQFDTSTLNVWDVRSGSVRTLIRGSAALGAHESGLAGECLLAGKVALCVAAGPSEPPRLIAADLATGRVRTVFDPNPTLTPDRLGVASSVVLHDRFGGSTFGRLILPRDHRKASPLPLVITSYTCGGFLQGGSGHDVPEHVFAGLGFAAMCIDHSFDVVRRAASRPVTWENVMASNRDFYDNAVDTLVAEGIVDPERVGLTGFSGSSTAVASAITKSRRFTAASVTTEGSLDPIVCYLATQYDNCKDWVRKDGTPRPVNPDTGEVLGTPALDAGKISAPFLMQLAEVEYMTMMQLYDAMSDLSLAVEMRIFPGAYHVKHQPRQRLAVYDRNVAWFEFWLSGTKNAATEGGEEKVRWQKMRNHHCSALPGQSLPSDLPWYCRDGQKN